MKSKIREAILKSRKDNNDEHNIANSLIAKNVKAILDTAKGNNVVGLYCAIKGEPNLFNLITDTEMNYALPRIKEGEIEFVTYRPGITFETSIFNNIIQPKDGIKLVPDIVIVPGVAYSSDGTRLGFGMGGYDKYFFAKHRSNIIKIGVCFHENLYERLPGEAHDVKMNYVITDKIIIKL